MNQRALKSSQGHDQIVVLELFVHLMHASSEAILHALPALRFTWTGTLPFEPVEPLCEGACSFLERSLDLLTE